MKNNENIDEAIKKALTDYIDADTKEETADVKYSKEHEARMKQMFEDMKKDTKNKKSSREIVIRIKFDLVTKIAVAVVALIVVTLTLSTGIKAWKENNKLEMFGDNEEYSWLLSENTSEIYETKTSAEDEAYVKGIFEGISGEIQNIEITNINKMQRITFYYNKELIQIKIRKDMNVGINTEGLYINSIQLGENNQLYYYQENEKHSYKWEFYEYYFDMYGNVSLESAIKIIKSMNYEKIETNF